MIKQKVIVSGSLVYDRIMDFPGFFKDHILADQVHILNVSFTLHKITESFGGTAGNIAYNLSLLNVPTQVLGVVGDDFISYSHWLKAKKVDISQVKKVFGHQTASAYIITDKSDNQISAFYPGPLDHNYCRVAKTINNIALAIISPEFKARMLEYARIYKGRKISYIFDPGQQLTSFTRAELKYLISGAKVVMGNDYEIKLILKKLNLTLAQLNKLTAIVVVTLGAKGSTIYADNKKINIPPVKVKKVIDPTGAGDAYRAGFIKGLIEGWPLAKVGRLASLIATYTVDKEGTQTHEFTYQEIQNRYYKHFKEKL